MKESLFPSASMHPEAIHTSSKMFGQEELWIPETPAGNFREWARLTLHPTATGIQRENLTLLPVQYQRCIADYRNMLGKLFGKKHGQETFFGLEGPTGAAGETMTVECLMRKAKEALLIWRNDGKSLDENTVRTLTPDAEAIKQFGQAFLSVTAVQVVAEKITKPKQIPTPSKAAPRRAPESLEETLTSLALHFQSVNATPTTPEEIRLQKNIDANSAMFDKMKQLLLTAIRALPQKNPADAHRIQMLQVPFHIELENRKNNLQNAVVVKRLAANAGVPDNVASLSQATPFQFTCSDNEMHSLLLAGFAMQNRTVYLPKALESSEMIRFLALYHELLHVHQLGMRIQKFGIDRTMKNYGKISNHKSVALADELEAYGSEIEILNLLLDGAMQRSAQEGKMVDPEFVLHKLSISEKFKTPVHLLCHFGLNFYKGKKEDGSYTQGFVQEVARCQIFDGFTLYKETPTGEFVQI